MFLLLLRYLKFLELLTNNTIKNFFNKKLKKNIMIFKTKIMIFYNEKDFKFYLFKIKI